MCLGIRREHDAGKLIKLTGRITSIYKNANQTIAKVYLDPAWIELALDPQFTPDLGETVLLETQLVNRGLEERIDQNNNKPINQQETKGGKAQKT